MPSLTSSLVEELPPSPPEPSTPLPWTFEVVTRRPSAVPRSEPPGASPTGTVVTPPDRPSSRRLTRWSDRGGSSAIAGERTWFHLVYRLLLRLYQSLCVSARPGSARWMRWAAPVWAAGDVAGAIALRRSPRLALAPRLLADAADTAFWSHACPGEDDSSVLNGVPLAAEAGVRMGPAALVVPVANAALAAVAHRISGKPVRLGSFVWQAAGVVAGMGSAAYEESWRRTTRARQLRELAAQTEHARLLGQNALAMSLDSAVDLLMRTVPLLYPLDSSASPENLLADWKRALAAQTQSHATYLGIALHRWQAEHNDTPDLSFDVDVALPEDHGTIILSPWQEQWLHSTLVRMRLRGPVSVHVVEPDRARMPNRPIVLSVNQVLVTIPRDPIPELEPFDLGPAALIAQAGWFLGTSLRGQAQSRVEAVAFPALGSLVLAAWATRRLEEEGEAARGPILLGAFGLVIAQAALATATMRAPRTPSGLQRFPTASSLIAASILTAFYWPELRRSHRTAAISLVATTLAVGVAVSPESLGARDLLSEGLWPISAALSAARLPGRVRQQTEQLDHQMRTHHEEQVQRAFDEGRATVIDLVATAHAQASAILETNRPLLDARLAQEAERRLAEVAARLDGLR